MENKVKVVILCNNPVAIHAIREFLFYGAVAAVVVTKRNKEMQGLINEMIKDTGSSMVIVTRHDYKEKLIELIKAEPITAVLMMTFPFIIPEDICKMPEKGFINFHFGLLPQCRGPQPILWHMLNNDPEVGITVHKVDSGIDTGEIIMQEKTPIEPTDTYGSLQSKLAYLAAKPAANLLKILNYGKIIPSFAQDETKAAYYEMPGASTLTINWQTMTAAQIVRLVNACNPWNKGAGTSVNGWFIGITAAEIVEGDAIEMEPGTIIHCDKENGVIVKTSDNKKIKLNIVYTSEGFYLGINLIDFGIVSEMKFA